ncbi:LOW QUALITY PROTEIN: cystinosin homolog [Penaeus chinensis]|uniref:LOW QUALITY PROTEIN: cystinosin homolog n=1 Tax=Penaeus chinensis TaxID=139456 RepID=UPI001FB635BB|nr:LOW QUALITY PROTEIN: cystinosin homolog [Penaeus chinensis]
MAATSSFASASAGASLRVLALHLCFLLIGTAAETPAIEFIQVDVYDGNVTSVCKFTSQDVLLVDHESTNITLVVTGEAEENTTLMFVQEKDVIKPLPNITLPVGALNETFILNLMAENAGHSVIVTKALPGNMTDVSKAFMRISVSHSDALEYASDVVGWVYFVAWSVSFYPQTYSNWKRKSVIGLHFDFLSLNIVGFFVYSLFNVCLYWIPSIEADYFKRHPYGVNPVQLNDVIFSLHAFLACGIQVFQCFIYDRGDQQISLTARYILTGITLSSVVMTILGAASAIQWLDFLYFMSYVKLFITLIKYIPQAYYNYRRKSTSGWSIGNILLDFTGGSLSIAQMFILSYNYNDWGSIFGDPTKFGLGIFSIIFDIFFMVQHYILYRGNEDYLRVLEPESQGQRNSLTASISSADYGSTGNQ